MSVKNINQLTYIYNSGYHAGHHDTVEGRYIDIFHSDMDSYHSDEVEEISNDFISVNTDYDELRERVAWMLECDEFLEWINPTNRRRAMFCYPEMRHIFNAARKAVEEIL